MTVLNFILIIILILISIAFLFTHIKNKRSLNNLINMVDKAFVGNFSEEIYDESMLSSIETKFYQYFRSTLVSKSELEHDKQKVKQLISDISHQTKTPITNIILYTQLIKESEQNELIQKYLEALENQSEKLKFLIDNLIKSSRLETDIIKLNICKNNIQDIFNNVYTQSLPNAKQKNIQINLCNTQATAKFDLKWTCEAVFNIVDNAIKYSPNNSIIKIDMKTYDFFCCIEICDQGIGISEHETPKIFSRFYRSQNVSDISGLGIGLYLSREIITSQHGYIKVKKNVDKGSTFSVYLPIN